MTTPPRYYLDTEFIDDGVTETLQLISIGIICDDGRELYLVNSEFDESRCDDWLKENVLKQLPLCTCPGGGALDHLGHNAPDCKWRTRNQIRDAIIAFVPDPGNEVKPEFWAFFASYDWVLFAQLFGKMINLPKHFPWLVNDLKTWAKHLGYTGKFKELLPNTGHHDALADARWNRDVHKILMEKLTSTQKLLGTTLVEAMALYDEKCTGCNLQTSCECPSSGHGADCRRDREAAVRKVITDLGLTS